MLLAFLCPGCERRPWFSDSSSSLTVCFCACGCAPQFLLSFLPKKATTDRGSLYFYLCRHPKWRNISRVCPTASSSLFLAKAVSVLHVYRMPSVSLVFISGAFGPVL